jgi:hypothetical protein
MDRDQNNLFSQDSSEYAIYCTQSNFVCDTVYLFLGSLPSLRNDRFSSIIPGCNEEKFQESQFLVYYNQTETYPSNYSVINSLIGLKGIHNSSHPVLASIHNEPEEHNVIKVYTSNHLFGQNTFYRYVNQELCRDNKTTLKKLMPFIRRAAKQINNNGPSQSCVVYRGMQLDQEQRNFFTQGKVFRFPGFTSTTLSKDIAKTFGNILFEIRIFAGCHQVRDVANISYFTYEQEWLFSPYSRFKVIGRNYNTIILDSLDNIGTV